MVGKLNFFAFLSLW